MRSKKAEPMIEQDESAEEALFRIAERALIGLYDRGVLSPAILEQVIAAFASSNVDWNATPTLAAADGRHVDEISAGVMMPSRSSGDTSTDFEALVNHIAGLTKPAQNRRRKQPPVAPDNSQDDADLVAQLGGSGTRRRGKTDRNVGSAQPRKPTMFSPLVNPRLPRRSKD